MMTGEEYWIKATSSGLSTVEHPWYCSLPVYVKRYQVHSFSNETV